MPESQEILNQIAALGAELRARLDAMDERLARIESELSIEADDASATGTNGHATYPPPAPTPEPSGPLQTVAVTISPLHDVSRVRVVEAAFDAIEGVDSTVLQTLSGNTARLEVHAREDVALISGLRRTLQLAFDVSESDSTSFTIALAQPGAGREGGVAAHDLP